MTGGKGVLGKINNNNNITCLYLIFSALNITLHACSYSASIFGIKCKNYK